jgi:hypothetical protein
MKIDRRNLASVVGALLMAAVMFGRGAQAAEPVTVPTVLKVSLTKGVMVVTGEVPTGGYTDPMLIKVTYVKQPDDGIQDFTFVATKPTGIVTQAVTKITARYDWKGELPAWVKGVRIHGVGDGIKTAILEK